MQGYSPAQATLGAMYADGIGVLQDFVYAHMWLNIAASQGVEGATEFRDLVAKIMTPEQIAEAQTLAREWNPESNEVDTTQNLQKLQDAERSLRALSEPTRKHDD
jgi:TPR repeat protein